ncbi:MAG: hypothetical protein FWB92_02855 [Oscillospiraceae bacterium]|nr:hypothetical protein [Oscillospiraceae bacterium]
MIGRELCRILSGMPPYAKIRLHEEICDFTVYKFFDLLLSQGERLDEEVIIATDKGDTIYPNDAIYVEDANMVWIDSHEKNSDASMELGKKLALSAKGISHESENTGKLPDLKREDLYAVLDKIMDKEEISCPYCNKANNSLATYVESHEVGQIYRCQSCREEFRVIQPEDAPLDTCLYCKIVSGTPKFIKTISSDSKFKCNDCENKVYSQAEGFTSEDYTLSYAEQLQFNPHCLFCSSHDTVTTRPTEHGEFRKCQGCKREFYSDYPIPPCPKCKCTNAIFTHINLNCKPSYRCNVCEYAYDIAGGDCPDISPLKAKVPVQKTPPLTAPHPDSDYGKCPYCQHKYFRYKGKSGQFESLVCANCEAVYYEDADGLIPDFYSLDVCERERVVARASMQHASCPRCCNEATVFHAFAGSDKATFYCKCCEDYFRADEIKPTKKDSDLFPILDVNYPEDESVFDRGVPSCNGTIELSKLEDDGFGFGDCTLGNLIPQSPDVLHPDFSRPDPEQVIRPAGDYQHFKVLHLRKNQLQNNPLYSEAFLRGLFDLCVKLKLTLKIKPRFYWTQGWIDVWGGKGLFAYPIMPDGKNRYVPPVDFRVEYHDKRIYSALTLAKGRVMDCNQQSFWGNESICAAIMALNKFEPDSTPADIEKILEESVGRMSDES